MATTGLDFDYYQLYLMRHLQDICSPKANDVEFIQARSESASEEYERMRRAGASFHGAQELAMQVLLEDLE